MAYVDLKSEVRMEFDCYDAYREEASYPPNRLSALCPFHERLAGSLRSCEQRTARML